jgi:hypothetical protein
MMDALSIDGTGPPPALEHHGRTILDELQAWPLRPCASLEPNAAGVAGQAAPRGGDCAVVADSAQPPPDGRLARCVVALLITEGCKIAPSMKTDGIKYSHASMERQHFTSH